MESNWRWNIADQGLTWANLRFFARVLDLPNYWIGKDRTGGTGRLQLWYKFDPDQLPVLLGPIGNWFLPFPAGFNVEPDR